MVICGDIWGPLAQMKKQNTELYNVTDNRVKNLEVWAKFSESNIRLFDVG